MQSELIPEVSAAPQSGPLALLLAAFDGVPHAGSRELRLSKAEQLELKAAFPHAVFEALCPDEDLCWYRVTL